MNIKIFDKTCCAACSETGELVKRVVAELGIEAEIENVTDFVEFAKHSVGSTPTVIIDGVVKIAGRVPKEDEVMAWFRNA